MISDNDELDRIAELLVHVGRAARSENAASGLTAAQWACLRFFARANGSTCTPSGFASFQATTRGTASQIIKTLERQGLLARRPSDRDGRSAQLELTGTGRARLREDPLRDLIRAVGHLDTEERDRFLDTLSRLASGLAALKGMPAFGTCPGCRHFKPDGDSGHCACMDVALAPEEVDKLCANYRGAQPLRLEGDIDGRS